MDADKVLGEVRYRIHYKLYKSADALLDSLYEGWTQGKVKLTDTQVDYMFCLMGRLSNALYN